MLGTSICDYLENVEVYAFSSADLDITCTQNLTKKISRIQPDYIINCAAYTAVDLAETHQEKAYKINYHAVEKLAQIAAGYGATLIHFSTDYVFNGGSSRPYRPDDKTNPINVYGRSKLLGENAIRRTDVNHYIFRISWLYAPHGKNFFRWVLENDLETMKVVDNQVGSPTSALEVAQFINHVIHNDPAAYGTYHFTNAGSMSWYAFAKAILEKAALQKKIFPTSDFPTAARRPEYSWMESTLTEKVFEYEMASQESALSRVYQNYPDKD